MKIFVRPPMVASRKAPGSPVRTSEPLKQFDCREDAEKYIREQSQPERYEIIEIE